MDMHKTTVIILSPLILGDSSTEMPYKILSFQLVNDVCFLYKKHTKTKFWTFW